MYTHAGQPPVGAGTSPAVQNGSNETISDVPIGRGWKPCRHDIETVYANTSTTARWTQIDYYNGPNCYWQMWGRTPEHLSLDGQPPMYPRSVEQQISAALVAFYNENEVDSLLNIVESPQLPSSLQSLYKTANTDGVRRALSLVSSGYLAYSFGIAPLLSDMSKLAKAAKTLRSDLSKAISASGKEVTIRNTVRATGTAYKVNANSPYHQLEGMAFGDRTVSVRGTRGPAYSPNKMGQLMVALKRFGSPGPASFVWERIPFSFVLDWFMDTKLLFAQLDNLSTGNQKVVSNIMVTERSWLSSKMIHQSSYPYAIPGNGETVASSSKSRYERKIYSGRPPLVTWSNRFGKKQASLTAALLYQLVASRVPKQMWKTNLMNVAK